MESQPQILNSGLILKIFTHVSCQIVSITFSVIEHDIVLTWFLCYLSHDQISPLLYI